MRKAALFVVAVVAICYVMAGLESAQRTRASAGALERRLWPDQRVRYLISSNVGYEQQTSSPLCGLHNTADCEMPMRQGIILAAATYEEQTALTFQNESDSGVGPSAARDPELYLRHDHPHLLFLQGYGGETFSYSKLRNKYREWKARCQAAPAEDCDFSKPPYDPANAGMIPTDEGMLGWTYARDGQKLMRAAAGTPESSYKWPLGGAPPAGLAHDDMLITLPDPSSTANHWRK